eukprot:913295-Pyramimonas_sp.AAC.1
MDFISSDGLRFGGCWSSAWSMWQCQVENMVKCLGYLRYKAYPDTYSGNGCHGVGGSTKFSSIWTLPIAAVKNCGALAVHLFACECALTAPSGDAQTAWRGS